MVFLKHGAGTPNGSQTSSYWVACWQDRMNTQCWYVNSFCQLKKKNWCYFCWWIFYEVVRNFALHSANPIIAVMCFKYWLSVSLLLCPHLPLQGYGWSSLWVGENLDLTSSTCEYCCNALLLQHLRHVMRFKFTVCRIGVSIYFFISRLQN